MGKKVIIEKNKGVEELVYKELNATEKELNEKIVILKEWFGKQPHLPKNITNKKLETFLLLNKLNIEKTKRKLDMYFTIRSFFPQYFSEIKITDPKVKESFKSSAILPLPKQYGAFRIIASKLFLESKYFNPITTLAISFQALDVLVEEDYSAGIICIADARNMNMSHLKFINFNILKCLRLVIEEVYSGRIKAIHMICDNAFLENILTLLKYSFKQKLFDRITVHKDVESLTKIIPKNVLPCDFGGHLKDFQEIAYDWYDTLVEWESYINELNSFKVDEAFRPKELDSDLFEDIQGTFKKLDID